MERTAEISLFGRGDKKGYHLGGDDLYGLTFDLKCFVQGFAFNIKKGLNAEDRLGTYRVLRCRGFIVFRSDKHNRRD